MGLFGKSFEQKVAEAIAEIDALGLGVYNLGATVNGKIITLTGQARTLAIKAQIVEEISQRVEAENVINTIRLIQPEPVVQAVASVPSEDPTQATPASSEPELYVVKPGDTLGALAQRFYGKAGLYMRIFEANRDILSDPNLIKVGQKLRIPRP
jgi:nucleoid-associated protein YgaU